MTGKDQLKLKWYLFHFRAIILSKAYVVIIWQENTISFKASVVGFLRRNTSLPHYPLITLSHLQ